MLLAGGFNPWRVSGGVLVDVIRDLQSLRENAIAIPEPQSIEMFQSLIGIYSH